jgi:hypothetical protein
MAGFSVTWPGTDKEQSITLWKDFKKHTILHQHPGTKKKRSTKLLYSKRVADNQCTLIVAYRVSNAFHTCTCNQQASFAMASSWEYLHGHNSWHNYLCCCNGPGNWPQFHINDNLQFNVCRLQKWRPDYCVLFCCNFDEIISDNNNKCRLQMSVAGESQMNPFKITRTARNFL